jgi:predicted RNA-binding Zn ribbon-like protein
LNTEATVEGSPFDFWKTGDDVLRWLVRAGFLPDGSVPEIDQADLLAAARELRSIARELIELRAKEAIGNPERLNSYLREAVSYPCVVWSAAANVTVVRLRKQETPRQILAPVAEAVALLLAEGDFQLVRTCGHPDCSMWFYDRTKSHKRRAAWPYAETATRSPNSESVRRLDSQSGISRPRRPPSYSALIWFTQPVFE